jgi:alcohol dehydrogenase class IV
MPWPEAETLSGSGSLMKMPEWLKGHGRKSVLIVTDSVLAGFGYSGKLAEGLKAVGINAVVYDKVVPNPTIGNIEEGLKIYKENNCDCIVALGGGSPMDCAKGIGCRVARPNKPIEKMKGTLKVGRKLPPLYAIPTTAGTGSEVTLAAVISNPEKQEKYPIEDPVVIPRYIVFDPQLTIGLPPHVTSTTGMDALTHAVESYIGKSNTKATKQQAIEATQLIFKYLKRAYDNGQDIEAREQMQKAAWLAGKAFTRAYVGYVHAVAHALGGFYGVPHGLANAVALPYVLKKFGASAHKRLAELADAVGIKGKDDAEKANAFIKAIEDMNAQMNIPTKISGRWTIKDEDIDRLVDHAIKEANPLYPVPTIFGKEEIKDLFLSIKE